MKFYYLLFFVVSIFHPVNIQAQNDLSVDDYVFICDNSIDSIEQKLQSGINAFIFKIEESNGRYTILNSAEKVSFKNTLNSVKNFITSQNEVVIPLIFKGNFNKDRLSEFLITFFSKKILIPSNKDWPKINSLKEKGINIVVIYDTSMAATSIEQIRNNKYQNRFSSNPQDKIILYSSNTKTDSILLQNCLEMWKSTGKPPNLLVAKNIEIANQKRIADSLNNLRRFRGIVEYNNEPLNEIFWAKSSGVITPSKFSFPLTDSEQILSPYKNGYRITPAEVIHHSFQTDAPRTFSSYNIDIEDKLIYDFSFENEVVNKRDENWKRFISKDITFIKDSERGNVLKLDKTNSYIDYSKGNILNFDTPISISTWIKTDSLHPYMGILGFGVAFSVKLIDGYPDFTTATIKDHIIEQRLNINEWYHLVTIYNPKTTVEFYLNGEKIGESITKNIVPSEQSLVIGNNVWGEQFYGTIDDLKIWNRGLSAKEVKTLYLLNPIEKDKTYIWVTFLTLLIPLLIFLLLNRKKTTSRYIKIRKEHSTEKPAENMLYLFGNFNVNFVSKEVSPPSFSPLQRQLLSFLILVTLDEKKGVNTTKLTETFWPGVSKLKAKENRNGNIRKLRMTLSKIEGIEVLFENKKWSVQNNSKFKIDLYEYIALKESIEKNLKNREVSINEIEELLQLLKRGNILQNTASEWVDYFKNKISNEVENLLSRIYDSNHEDLNTELNIQIAKTILLFDTLNENALKILIIELVSAGKHGQAKNIFVAFSKNYELLYAEPFGVEFQTLVKNNPN